MKTCLRPLSLSWGPDAREAISAGRAGSLAGGSTAFAEAEIIRRGQPRVVLPYRSLRDEVERAVLAPFEQPRPPLAGISLDAPRIMGIVNVTPDSFSDGGLLENAKMAVAHGVELMKEGAHIVDVGGESTRPGSREVALQEELRRVVPVIEGLNRAGAIVSVDTRKAPVMMAAAEARAAIINDVSALQFDPASLKIAANLGLPVILMHAQGTPETMQKDPRYDDVVLDVYDALEARIAACLEAGIPRARLAADPGIGFGKTSRHNLELLQRLTIFHGLGVPILVGLSRKGFTGQLTGEPQPGNRVYGSVSGAVHCALHGAQILRVHDVKATRQALSVAFAAVDPDASGM
jgi:dihydropteroate synthase